MTPNLVHDLGGYLREQRTAARLSLRQLSELAGISNPYLSQIERGLKKPSAEILQQIARGLQVSAESLYVRAGILEVADRPEATSSVLAAIAADPRLSARQREVLVEVYRSFVDTTGEPAAEPNVGSSGDPTTTAAEVAASIPKNPPKAPSARPGRATPSPRAAAPSAATTGTKPVAPRTPKHVSPRL